MEDPESWRWIWLGAVAVFALGEIAIAGSFFLLPFAAGALVACIAAFAGAGLALQWALFVVVSIAGAIGLVPLRRRLDRVEPQNGIGSRRLMGQEAVVVTEIPGGPGATGMVRLGREEWRAKSSDRTPVAVGSVVEVVDVRGTSVVVRAVSAVPPPPPGGTP
jgi:membrane protein implicated in regulation of membrane protease activity